MLLRYLLAFSFRICKIKYNSLISLTIIFNTTYHKLDYRCYKLHTRFG
jgi:hypothetical protein